MMNIRILPRTSDCVEVMYVNVIAGTVEVAYTKGSIYRYSNVSRRAITNLLLNPSMSLGFWVNKNCKTPRTSTRLLLSYEACMYKQPLLV